MFTLAYAFPCDYHGSQTLICILPECRSYMTLSLRASSEAATQDQPVYTFSIPYERNVLNYSYMHFPWEHLVL